MVHNNVQEGTDIHFPIGVELVDPMLIGHWRDGEYVVHG